MNPPSERRFPYLLFGEANARASSRVRFSRAKGPVPYQPGATLWVTRHNNRPSSERATKRVRCCPMDRPYRASFSVWHKPRAMPWAGIGRTVGAGNPERDLLAIIKQEGRV